MIVDEGDPYSALLVNKSVNRLKAKGIFGKVEEKVLEGSLPDLKILEISVEESATGEIAAGAGVGTDGTSFMVSVSENNWLGRGIKLQSSLNVSEEKLSGNIAVQTNETSTYYLTPFYREIYESKNEDGNIALFPSWLEHYTDQAKPGQERITLGVDLIPFEAYEIGVLEDKKSHWEKL